jgi:hypothetical protein
MADLLTQAGFQVSRNLNTGQADLKAAVDQFGTRLRSPTVKFAIFYYAGHGVQIDWRNYLIPVDAKVRSAEDVRAQAVDVSELLHFMDQTKDKSFLVILDACRDDPFGGNFKVASKGLSQFDGPVGSLLAYSTSPGNVAMDGNGDNGLYTSHLLRELSVRNAKLEDAFKRVRLNVRLESGGRQIPWESTSLEEDIYLFKSETKKLTEAEQEALIEKEVNAWKKVKTSTDPRVLANFIREFPSGSTSELAQSRLNRILVGLSSKKGQGDSPAQPVEKSGKASNANLLNEKAEKAAREAQAKAEELRIADEKAKRTIVDDESNRLAEARRQETFRLAAEAQLKLILEAKIKERQKQEELLQARKREEEQLALAKAASDKLDADKLEDLRIQKLEAERLASERDAAAAALAKSELERRQEASRLAITQAAEAKHAQDKLLAAKQEAEKARLIAEQEAAAQSQLAAQAARDAQARAEELRIADEKVRQAKAAAEAALANEAKQQEAFRLANEAQLKEIQEAKAKELQRQAALHLARENEQKQIALAAAAAAKLEADKAKVIEAQKAEAMRLAAEREAESARLAAAEAERRQEFNLLSIAQIAEAKRAQEQLVVLQAEAEKARLAALNEAQELAKNKQDAKNLPVGQTAQIFVNASDVQLASSEPLMALAPTPFFMGSNVFARQYNVGDEFGFRVIDHHNVTEKPLVLKVTSVDADADRVEYNGGEYTSDMMGNITRNVRGALDQPRQFYPADLFIGKRWKTQFKQTRSNGTVYTFKYELKVVGKETVTVPAGTFDTYKIEANGFNMELGASLQRNIWVAPGINADIAHETFVRLRNGQIDQNDRQELVRYSSSTNRLALNTAE